MYLFFISIYISLIDTEYLAGLISESFNLLIEKKIDIISSKLLNTPYKESPIGEGSGIDPDPIINFEFVDCLTFVEYVIAFVNSKNLDEFEEHIIKLRYKNGKIDFYNRLHLPDFQWFPNAVKNGYLQDITKEVGGKYLRILKKTLNKDFDIKGYKIDSSNLLTNEVLINYIGKEHISDIFNKIPQYSVIRILRKDSFRPYVTTHIGIVVIKGNKKYLRHASRHFGRKVTDTPLGMYFSTFEKYENWEALGIAIYKIGDISN